MKRRIDMDPAHASMLSEEPGHYNPPSTPIIPLSENMEDIFSLTETPQLNILELAAAQPSVSVAAAPVQFQVPLNPPPVNPPPTNPPSTNTVPVNAPSTNAQSVNTPPVLNLNDIIKEFLLTGDRSVLRRQVTVDIDIKIDIKEVRPNNEQQQ
jgi:hypothetical protein